MPVKLTVLVATCLILAPLMSNAQVTSECQCDGVFEQMVQKLEANYIGYTLTKDQINDAYQKHLKQFRNEVKQLDPLHCTAALNRFLTFFHDGHLFALAYPNYSEEELASFSKQVQSKRFDLSEVKQDLVSRRNSLADLEGIWTDGQSRFALVRNVNKAWPYEYVAVVLESPKPEKLGELKFGVSLVDGKYQGEYYANTYAPRFTQIELAKSNSLLGIWGGILWGRVAYTDTASILSAPLVDPIKPTVKELSAGVVLVTIPTFLIEKPVFDSVLLQNQAKFLECQALIIDIRGNGGGNGIYFDLLKCYADKPMASEIGRALASPDNLEYFTRFAGKEPDDPYRPVVEEMTNSMGKLVTGPHFGDLKLERYPTKMEKVVILTDKANASAAETFILYSKGISDKVVTLGTNTAGVVDYNNVNIVKLSCDKYGYSLGYPTYTFNSRVPAEGYNKTGIPPDISSEKTGDDLIAEALELVKK